MLQEFIREGCLQKIDRKGPQPRMFFLVSHRYCFLCRLRAFHVVEREPQKERGKGEKIGKSLQVLISSSFECLRFVIGLENVWGFYYGKSGKWIYDQGNFKSLWPTQGKVREIYFKAVKYRAWRAFTVDNDRLPSPEKTVSWKRLVLVLVVCLLMGCYVFFSANIRTEYRYLFCCCCCCCFFCFWSVFFLKR